MSDICRNPPTRAKDLRFFRRRRPTAAQRDYLERGLAQAGGKLPLFDGHGQAVAPRTVQACIKAGWAAPWFNNPMKPDWLVCRLTDQGYQVLGTAPPVTLPG